MSTPACRAITRAIHAGAIGPETAARILERNLADESQLGYLQNIAGQSNLGILLPVLREPDDFKLKSIVRLWHQDRKADYIVTSVNSEQITARDNHAPHDEKHFALGSLLFWRDSEIWLLRDRVPHTSAPRPPYMASYILTLETALGGVHDADEIAAFRGAFC